MTYKKLSTIPPFPVVGLDYNLFNVCVYEIIDDNTFMKQSNETIISKLNYSEIDTIFANRLYVPSMFSGKLLPHLLA